PATPLTVAPIVTSPGVLASARAFFCAKVRLPFRRSEIVMGRGAAKVPMPLEPSKVSVWPLAFGVALPTDVFCDGANAAKGMKDDNSPSVQVALPVRFAICAPEAVK